MGRTRREILTAAALGSAWLLSGCGGDPAPRPVPRGSEADIRVLTRLLELERRVEQAYEQLARLLPSDAHSFRAHEAEHALALEEAIRDLGASPPAATSSAVPRIRDRGSALEFMGGLEHTSIAAYLGSIPRVGSGELRGTLAAALTVDAEHVAVLSDVGFAALLGEKA